MGVPICFPDNLTSHISELDANRFEHTKATHIIEALLDIHFHSNEFEYISLRQVVNPRTMYETLTHTHAFNHVIHLFIYAFNET